MKTVKIEAFYYYNVDGLQPHKIKSIYKLRL